MRVIGGEFRSRRLQSVPGMVTRPTPDRLRESLFSILTPKLEGATFVDCYAGTGAVGIEAVSRGAAKVIFIERARPALHVLRANLASLRITDRVQVIVGRPSTELRGIKADIVFLDPPYDEAREYEGVLSTLGANPPGLVIVQHASKFDPGDEYGSLRRYRSVKQGDNFLSFYSPAEQR